MKEPSADSPSAFGRAFSALQEPNFRWLFSGMVLSMSGMQMMSITQPWLAYRLSGSGLALGAVAAVGGLSLAIFSPIGGVVADRYNRRTILLCTQASMAGSTLFLAAVVFLDVAQTWHVAVAAFLQGGTFPFNMTARQSYIPQLVPGPRLPNALALDSSAMQFSRSIAPAGAGVLLGWSPTAALTVAALCYVAAFYPLLHLPAADRVHTGARPSMASEAMGGVSYVLANRTLLALVGIAAAIAILGLSYQQFLPVFQADVLHVGTSRLGLMYTAAGLGTLAGAMTVAFLVDAPSQGKLLPLSGIGMGVALFLFGASSIYVVSLLMLTVIGFTQQAFLTSNRLAIIMRTEPAYHGRVLGLWFLTFSLTSASALPIGASVDAFGAQSTFIAIGVALTAIMAWAGSRVPATLRPVTAVEVSPSPGDRPAGGG